MTVGNTPDRTFLNISPIGGSCNSGAKQKPAAAATIAHQRAGADPSPIFFEQTHVARPGRFVEIKDASSEVCQLTIRPRRWPTPSRAINHAQI